MRLTPNIITVVMAMLLSRGMALAQLPVEFFGGHQKTTVDIMFFKFIRHDDGQHTRFLFFNRNRASIDYAMTETTHLPQFGFTEAISYNHEKLKGFAPVMVASILNRGVYPKAGVQYAKVKTDFTLFSWLVSETLQEPNIDFFLLVRYTPKLTDRLNLFSQVELVIVIPTLEQHTYSFTQRLRLGLKISAFQWGAGLDLSQSGNNDFISTENVGGFLRYEF